MKADGEGSEEGVFRLRTSFSLTALAIDLAMRLQQVQFECADAIYLIIMSRDSAASYFYLDPPYLNSDMGHYDGYSREDFEALLKLLSEIQGKFLLSPY